MVILTPYKAQKELIIKMMHTVPSLKAKTTKPKVATITDSQGNVTLISLFYCFVI